MSSIAIYGAGGLGREILLMMHQIEARERQWNINGFFDDLLTKGTLIDELRVMGGIDELNQIRESMAVVLAVADPLTRKQLKKKITNPNITFPFLAHPAANLGSRSNKFGSGTIITAGVICTTGISIGDFSIINLSGTIGHDVSIGKYSTLMPACHISGNVSIGDNVLIGTGACILQNLKIGNASKIGAGAVVTRDVPDNVTVVGIPAKSRN